MVLFSSKQSKETSGTNHFVNNPKLKLCGLLLFLELQGKQIPLRVKMIQLNQKSSTAELFCLSTILETSVALSGKKMTSTRVVAFQRRNNGFCDHSVTWVTSASCLSQKGALLLSGVPEIIWPHWTIKTALFIYFSLNFTKALSSIQLSL